MGDVPALLPCSVFDLFALFELAEYRCGMYRSNPNQVRHKETPFFAPRFQSSYMIRGCGFKIDIFRVDATSYEQGQVTRYGFVLAMIGISSAISWRAQRVPLLKRLGPISYIIVTAITALTYTPSQYRVRIDDEAEQSLRLWTVMLCSFDGAGKRVRL
jgi:hypothetical protein